MEDVVAKIRSSVSAHPHGCGYALICAVGTISVISLILGVVGDFQAFLGMPFWLIAAICIAGMVLGPILAIRWQQDHFNGKVAALEEQVAGLRSQVNFFESERPELSIEFADNDAAFVEYDHFVVKVSNSSLSKTAHSVLVQIHSFEPIGTTTSEAELDCSAISGLRLYSSFSAQGNGHFFPAPTVDIHGGAFAKFAISSSRFWENQLVIGNQDHGNRCLVEQGAYRMRIRASANDCDMQELSLVIGVNSEKHVIVERDKSIGKRNDDPNRTPRIMP